MNGQRREALAKQLKVISKHVSHVTRMTAEDVDCIERLYHLQAIRIALRQVKMELLPDYLERWEEALVQGNELDQFNDLLEEFPMMFDFAGKINATVINPQKGEKDVTTVNYFIPSINCGNCKRRIETWLSGVEGVQSVRVNVPTRQALITFEAPATDESLKAFLARVNYPVDEIDFPATAHSYAGDSCCDCSG